MSRPVVVVPYESFWPDAFARESAAVAIAFADQHIAIHHIGSTSVPGLHAKPIIDMLAVVRSITGLDAHTPAMESLGYQAMGEFGIPTRRYFRKDNAAGERTHHIHAFELNSPHIERHLVFRDYLRAHSHHAAQYGAIKHRLAGLHPNDIQSYMDGKDAFIKHTESLAFAWRSNSSNTPATPPDTDAHPATP